MRFDDDTAPDGAYHALSILGRCGPIDYEMSEIVFIVSRVREILRLYDLDGVKLRH